jgi:pimeloyl-ACP methyl ester carboxylesterase
MSKLFLGLALPLCILSLSAPARAQEHPTYGLELEGFDYSHPVERYRFKSQGSDVAMAFMDVKPQSPNGRTAVLLHGRNFCAATWEQTIAVLVKAGFRVIAPTRSASANRASRRATSSASSNWRPTPMPS